jgi:hypothetical protein
LKTVKPKTHQRQLSNKQLEPHHQSIDCSKSITSYRPKAAWPQQAIFGFWFKGKDGVSRIQIAGSTKSFRAMVCTSTLMVSRIQITGSTKSFRSLGLTRYVSPPWRCITER